MKLPYFDGAPLRYLPPEDEYSDAALAQVAPALQAFMALTPADRKADSRHVFAYYMGVRNAVGGDVHMRSDMTEPSRESDIWKHVQPETVTVRPPDEGDDQSAYVILHAACDWEPEHGLQMVWRDGTELVRVSGIDGRPLNSALQGKDVIYADPLRIFTTRRSPDP